MSKLINVSDDIYKTLSKLKGDESFSGVIRKLVASSANKEKILSFFGKGGIDAAKVKALSQDWKQWSDRYA